MAGDVSGMGKQRMRAYFRWVNFLEDRNLDGSVTLRWILEKSCEYQW
jgi:hypothetical protein